MAAAVIAALLVVFIIVDRAATSYVESPKFLGMLDKETSKGLKFTGSYSPLTRVGQLGMHTDSFSGKDGYKTIVSIDAHDISGTFNPIGVILRRWQLDSIHIKSGSVMIQKTDPTPGAPKGVPFPPWWSLFWPYRVHLADVVVDKADILWHLQDKESGIYQTFLEITPNGRDYEYDARGGTFKTPMSPDLEVVHTHLLIRKPRLYCPEFVLTDDNAHPDHGMQLSGDAGLQDDHSIHLKVDINSLKVAPWLPEKIRAHVKGMANGNFDYTSTGTGLETASGKGQISIVDGILSGLAPVHQYVTVTGSPDPGDLGLKVCRTDVRFDAGAMTAENIDVECEGVFRLTGTLSIAKDKALSGTVELGMTDRYIKWLPTARTAIFTRTEGEYHFTTIHFSGTTQKPEQDLSARIVKEIEKSPLLALKLFFNQAGAWFDTK